VSTDLDDGQPVRGVGKANQADSSMVAIRECISTSREELGQVVAAGLVWLGIFQLYFFYSSS
jgi:hypothetical protein